MRITSFIILGALATNPCAEAQTSDIALGSQERKTHVAASTVLQRYDDTFQITEFSFPVSISIPIERSAEVSAAVAFASASGGDFETLSGVTDLQLHANYVAELGRSSVVFGLGAVVPLGKRDLTVNEFDVSVILSQHGYDFRVPGFGQDFRYTPSVAVAMPVAGDVVAGFGASYVFRGTYSPLAALDDSFGPGNELALTAGLDSRLSPSTYLSADLTFTTYGTDTLGETELVQVGNKIVAIVQWQRASGPDRIRLLGIYRNQSRTTSPNVAIASDERTTPSTGEVRGSYSRKLRNTVTLEALGRVRFIGSNSELRLLSGESVSFTSLTVVDFGGGAVFEVDEDIELPIRLLARVGDIRGFAIEAGLRASF
ncbi:MAG: hypothetical protein KJO98_09325 [Rhodothermia bacterium]|nr:hypothetical protein [Rhodothermia bacterium]